MKKKWVGKLILLTKCIDATLFINEAMSSLYQIKNGNLYWCPN